MASPFIPLGGKKQFQTELLRWYKQHQRDLPWRRTRNPYAIMVSELMLQQTQVDRVIPKFNAWMKRFPTLQKLAAARPKTVIAHWQGLGYNRRALYLHNSAKKIVNDLGGAFPNTKEGLLDLPGIGEYTSGAILSFAFEYDEPIVDTNVQRVVGRIFAGFKKLPTLSESTLWDMSTRLIPKKGNTYNFNQALMDFGSLVCQLRKPQCNECPFQKQCASYPQILDAAPAQLRYQKKANEKLYFGKPRRIWRGKILRVLHEKNMNGSTEQALGKSIQLDFTSTRLAWLRDVLSSLEKDKLIQRKKNRVYLP